VKNDDLGIEWDIAAHRVVRALREWENANDEAHREWGEAAYFASRDRRKDLADALADYEQLERRAQAKPEATA